MPTVTAIIPTRDRARLLLGALSSVASQTRPVDETIVVDDGSTDHTAQVLDHVARSWPRGCLLRVIRHESPHGANVARNAALGAAAGELVAFLDSDDLWHPEKLAAQLALVPDSAGKPAFVSCGRYRVDSRGGLIARQIPTQQNGDATLYSNWVGPLSSVVVDRQAALDAGGFDARLRAAQDWEFFIRVLPRCQVHSVPQPLLRYDDGNSGPKISRNSRARALAHLAIYRRHLRHRNPGPALAPFLRLLAEDLQQLGRLRWAAGLLARAERLRGRHLASRLLRGAPWLPDLRGLRYASYHLRSVPWRFGQRAKMVSKAMGEFDAAASRFGRRP